MDWNTIIITLLGSLLTGGGIGSLFLAKETKRTKRLENDKTVASEWKELYERTEIKIEKQSNRIEQLYNTIKEQREIIDSQNTKLAVSRLLECKKHACIDRDPPFGSQI